METTQIVLTIISSSIAASFLTSTMNWLIHQSNYKKDFYKKVIEKRMKAYEQVGIIQSDLGLLTNLGDRICHTICYSDELFNEFTVKLVEVKNQSFWLSGEVVNKLTELNIYLHNEVDNQIDFTKSQDEITSCYREIGVKLFDEIRAFRREINKIIDSDYCQLHKVKPFLKDKHQELNVHGIRSRKNARD